MNTLSRKQREIAERHALFLDTARDLLHEVGFHQLSMERVAELTDYSKGTVYQHFCCKEDMLIGVCCRAMSDLAALFERAIAIEGSHRDRIVAVGLAHELWFRLEPRNQVVKQQLVTLSLRDRASEESLALHDTLESRLIGTLHEIVEAAIRDGDLPADAGIDPLGIVFGLHALSFGGSLLQSHASSQVRRGGVEAPREDFAGFDLMRLLNALLDGFGWTPRYDAAHHAALIARLCRDVFADECACLVHGGDGGDVAAADFAVTGASRKD